MKRLIHLFFLIVTATVIILSCSKKGNSRTGEEETPSTTTTTSGSSSTTGSTTGSSTSGQATGTITGSPSCTLNPKQVISSNYISGETLTDPGDYQGSPYYNMYNFGLSYYVRLYFNSTMPPATGGYSVIAGYPPANYVSSNQVAITITPRVGTGYVGYGQSGVVYVTNTGTLVSAVFCNLPIKFESNGNTYSSVVSARIEK